MSVKALSKGILFSALISGGAVQAATYVYVSNAEDGNIGMYTLGADGSLKAGAKFDAGKPVMPMSVSRTRSSCSPRCAASRSPPSPTPSTARAAR